MPSALEHAHPVQPHGGVGPAGRRGSGRRRRTRGGWCPSSRTAPGRAPSPRPSLHRSSSRTSPTYQPLTPPGRTCPSREPSRTPGAATQEARSCSNGCSARSSASPREGVVGAPDLCVVSVTARSLTLNSTPPRNHPEEVRMSDPVVPRTPGRGPAPHGSVTLSDVARHVGVSAQSVSNALHNPSRVAPDTRERILSAVRELGYRPNRSARALRTQRSRLIGVKVEASRDDRAALLLDQFLHALAESAAGAGCHLILCQADGEAEEVAAYRELLDTTLGRGLRALRRPCRGRPREGAEGAGACPSRPSAGPGTATRRRRLGRRRRPGRARRRHRAPGGPRPPPDRPRRLAAVLGAGRDRRTGWREVCRGSGSTRPARRGRRRLRAGARRGPPAARATDAATAIACASDTLALGVLRALADRGLAPGPTSRSPASTTHPPPRSPRPA